MGRERRARCVDNGNDTGALVGLGVGRLWIMGRNYGRIERIECGGGANGGCITTTTTGAAAGNGIYGVRLLQLAMLQLLLWRMMWRMRMVMMMMMLVVMMVGCRW